MTDCVKCKISISDGEERELDSQILCEDCYVDAVSPPIRKTFYENDASEFMRRLKDTPISHPQKYH